MKKSTVGKILGMFAIVFILTFASVSAYSYNWDYSPYGSRSNDNYYRETKTINARDTDYFREGNVLGKKVTTTTQKVVIEKQKAPRYNSYSSCDRYYYSYDCDDYAPSNWRNAPVYRYGNYGDDRYGSNYYYNAADRYDWHSGFYNWNY